MLDRMEFNYEKVNDALYDLEYKGMLNALCCKVLQSCCRKIRRKMVRGKISEFDEEQLA